MYVPCEEEKITDSTLYLLKVEIDTISRWKGSAVVLDDFKSSKTISTFFSLFTSAK